LHEILTTIEEDLGNVLFLIGGDLNARIKDFIDFIDDDNLDYVYNGDVVLSNLCRSTLGGYINFSCSREVLFLRGYFELPMPLRGGDIFAGRER